jgi:hypothetical protein
MNPARSWFSGKALIQVGLCCLLGSVSGCAEVPAWERGTLARQEMAQEPQPAQRALLEHVYSSREAGAAGAAGQGGGCGCY